MPANPIPYHLKPKAPYVMRIPGKKRGCVVISHTLQFGGTLVGLWSLRKSNSKYDPQDYKGSEILRPDRSIVGQPSKPLPLP